MKSRILIGTRKSPLALAQAEFVRQRLLDKFPRTKFVLVPIVSKGDRIKTAAKLRKAGKGVFVKELENKLLNKKIDIAIHSLKDMPTVVHDGLSICVYLSRESPNDILISKNNIPLERLPEGSVVGTSSLRRQAFLKYAFKRLNFMDLRGNLDTRIEKLLSSTKLAGIVVAEVGLKRLYPNGIQFKPTQIPLSILPPAPGQGVVAIEIRSDNRDLEKKIKVLNDEGTQRCAEAERALLEKLEGGCNIPIGAYATLELSLLRLTAAVASLDGSRLIKDTAIGNQDEPESIAQALAGTLKNRGADEIIRRMMGQMPKELYFLVPAKKR